MSDAEELYSQLCAMETLGILGRDGRKVLSWLRAARAAGLYIQVAR